MAAWWFPANDHPRDKASFDIRITVPRGKDVVANGVLVSKRKKHGRITAHWRAVEPMAPYLAFFAAGDFETRSDSCNGVTNYVAVSKKPPGVGTRRDGQGAGRPDLHDRHGARERAGALPLLRDGRPRDRPPGDVRPGEPDPADVPPARRAEPGAAGARARAPVVRRLGLGQQLARHLAQRGVRPVPPDLLPHRGWSAAARCRPGSSPATTTFASEAGFWKLSIDDPGPERLFDGAVYVAGRDGRCRRCATGSATSRSGRCCGPGSRSAPTATARSPTSRRWPPRSAARTSTAFFDAWLHAKVPPAKTAENGLV